MDARLIPNIKTWSAKGALSIVGPTASGKSRLAMDWVDENFPNDKKHPLLVSVDTVAAYRCLDVGSAKASPIERKEYDWVGVDLWEPSQKGNSADFCKKIKPLILEALKKERPVLLIGGSFFLEKMLSEGAAPGKESNPKFIDTLKEQGAQKTLEELCGKDSRWGDFLHPNDHYRIFRYGDLVLRQGLSWSELREHKTRFSFEPFARVILTTPADHYEVMQARIEQMLAKGWIAEVESLVREYGKDAPALESIGYKQIVALLEGKCNPEELNELIFIAHRQLAKSQRTWMRSWLNRSSEQPSVVV